MNPQSSIHLACELVLTLYSNILLVILAPNSIVNLIHHLLPVPVVQLRVEGLDDRADVRSFEIIRQEQSGQKLYRLQRDGIFPMENSVVNEVIDQQGFDVRRVLLVQALL